MAAATRLAVTFSRPSRTAIAAAASITSARRWAGAFRRAAGCGGRAADWGLDVTAPMILGDTPIELLVLSPTVVKMRQKTCASVRIRTGSGGSAPARGTGAPATGGRLAIRLAPR